MAPIRPTEWKDVLWYPSCGGGVPMNTDRKTYTVIWHYCANYGSNQCKATSAQEAIARHLYANRKEIELFAFETSQGAHKPKISISEEVTQ